MFITLYQNYFNMISYDLLHKYLFTNFFNIPQLNELSILFTFLSGPSNSALYSLCFFDFFVQQKSKLLYSTNTKFQFNTAKAAVSLIGCKVTLHKKSLFTFLSSFILLYLPRVATFNTNLKQSLKKIRECQFSLVFSNMTVFKEFELFFKYFQVIEKLTFIFGFSKPVTWDFVVNYFYVRPLADVDIVELMEISSPQSCLDLRY